MVLWFEEEFVLRDIVNAGVPVMAVEREFFVAGRTGNVYLMQEGARFP